MRRLLAISILLASCQSYEVTDRPICGDQLLPEGVPCVLYPTSCGCAEGLRCGFSGVDLVCMTPGTKAAGDRCASESECGATTTCDSSRCRKTCFESLDCGTDAAVLCEVYSDSNDHPIAGICHRDCDPVSPSSPTDSRFEDCAAAESCRLDAFDVPACTPLGMAKPIGAACGDTDVCVAGAGCVSTESDQACRKYCWVEDPATCPAGRTCAPLRSQTNHPFVLLESRTLGACL
jgi:hypothetical protein